MKIRHEKCWPDTNMFAGHCNVSQVPKCERYTKYSAKYHNFSPLPYGI